MIAKSVYNYYWFGTCLRYLQDADSNYRLGNVGDHAKVIYNLKRFFEYLVDLDLQVTNRANSLKKLKDFYDELTQLDENATLSIEQASKLKILIKEIRMTLEAELDGFEAYVVTPKRLDVNKLLQDVPSLFSQGVYAKLPEIARVDIAEAGKCIAFERPTAAAFHLTRGTEAVLRTFYCSLAGRRRCALMWGPMVTDLRTRRKAAPHSVLLDNLDNIRRSFRNPTQHPEKVYDIDEAQDLWSLCVDAINRMAKVL